MKRARGDGQYSAFGQWMREKRCSAGFSSQPMAVQRARQLSKPSAVKQGKLSYIERGWNALPDPQLARELARLYGIDLEDLVARGVEAQYGVKMGPATDADRKRLPSPAPVVQFDPNERKLLEHFRQASPELQRAALLLVAAAPKTKRKRPRRSEDKRSGS